MNYIPIGAIHHSGFVIHNNNNNNNAIAISKDHHTGIFQNVSKFKMYLNLIMLLVLSYYKEQTCCIHVAVISSNLEDADLICNRPGGPRDAGIYLKLGKVGSVSHVY